MTWEDGNWETFEKIPVEVVKYSGGTGFADIDSDDAAAMNCSCKRGEKSPVTCWACDNNG